MCRHLGKSLSSIKQYQYQFLILYNFVQSLIERTQMTHCLLIEHIILTYLNVAYY